MRSAVFVMAALAGLATLGVASADGEVGLVIYWGDGSTSTACVGYSGDSITGDQVLARAGYDVNQFSGLVCGIDDVGCQHSGTFNSCTCECQTGGDSCTYWSFFEQEYGGQWRYSALGLFVAKAHDGDLQAWNWGPGSPASAPAPPETTFEAVCGHAPAAVSTVPPSVAVATVTPFAADGSPTGPAATSTRPATSATPLPGTATTAAPTATSTEAVATATATGAPTPIPEPPASGNKDSGGASNWGLAGFVTVAGVLVAGTVVAILLRLRRGG